MEFWLIARPGSSAACSEVCVGVVLDGTWGVTRSMSHLLSGETDSWNCVKKKITKRELLINPVMLFADESWMGSGKYENTSSKKITSGGPPFNLYFYCQFSNDQFLSCCECEMRWYRLSIQTRLNWNRFQMGFSTRMDEPWPRPRNVRPFSAWPAK